MGGAAGCARERGGGTGGGRGGAFTVEVMFARAGVGFNGGLCRPPGEGRRGEPMEVPCYGCRYRVLHGRAVEQPGSSSGS